MKCLCGFQHSPNSAPLLAKHVQDCMIDGPCKDILPLPVVVWRDGGFSVVREAEKGEQTYDIGLVRHEEPPVPSPEDELIYEAEVVEESE